MYKSWLFLILLLAFTVRFAGIETEDKKSRYALFSHDEYQHQQLAKLQLATLSPTLYEGENVHKGHYNARGFGYQLGFVLWIKHQIRGTEEAPSDEEINKTGRYLSTFYALSTIVILFLFCRAAFDGPTAVFSSFLLAVNDLNTTYSHYALPEVSYVFYLYLFLFGLWQYFDRFSWSSLVLLVFSAVGAFVTKFDFLPLLLTFGILCWPKTKHVASLIPRIAVTALLSFLFFQVLCFFNFSFEELRFAWNELRTQNQDVILSDNHWLHNPIIYLFGIVAALGLPVFVTAILGAIQWKKRWSSFSQSTRNTIAFLVLLIALEIGVRWAVDTPFVRRLEFFMPTFCLLAGYQLARWWMQKRMRLLPILTMLYCVFYLIASQINHWQDTRYPARDYLLTSLADASIAFSPYAECMGTPKNRKLEEADFYVIHESYYSRFGKSFTTPFKMPKCCEEVYHCFNGKEVCEFHQSLLMETHPEFSLHKVFATREIFPERILFHALFGHFETFRGDVMIFKRN